MWRRPEERESQHPNGLGLIRLGDNGLHQFGHLLALADRNRPHPEETRR